MDTWSLKKYLNMSGYTGYHHTFVSRYCFLVLMELVILDFLVDFFMPTAQLIFVLWKLYVGRPEPICTVYVLTASMDLYWQSLQMLTLANINIINMFCLCCMPVYLCTRSWAQGELYGPFGQKLDENLKEWEQSIRDLERYQCDPNFEMVRWKACRSTAVVLLLCHMNAKSCLKLQSTWPSPLEEEELNNEPMMKANRPCMRRRWPNRPTRGRLPLAKLTLVAAAPLGTIRIATGAPNLDQFIQCWRINHYM